MADYRLPRYLAGIVQGIIYLREDDFRLKVSWLKVSKADLTAAKDSGKCYKILVDLITSCR
jgi:hypothetical protein